MALLVVVNLRKDKKLVARADRHTEPTHHCEGETGVRIWALSDIHTDKAENLKWIQDLPSAEQTDQLSIPFFPDGEGCLRGIKLTLKLKCWDFSDLEDCSPDAQGFRMMF